jgi:hypothetical protein
MDDAQRLRMLEEDRSTPALDALRLRDQRQARERLHAAVEQARKLVADIQAQHSQRGSAEAS